MTDLWLLTDGAIPSRVGGGGGGGGEVFPSAGLVYQGDASFYEATHVDAETVENDPWPDKAEGPYEFLNTAGFIFWNADAFGNGYPSVEQQARVMTTGSGVDEFLDTTACTFFMVAYMPDDGAHHLLFTWNEEVTNPFFIRMQSLGDDRFEFIHGNSTVGEGHVLPDSLNPASAHRDAFHIFEFVKKEDLSYEILVDGAVEASGSFGATGSTIPSDAAGSHKMAIFKKFGSGPFLTNTATNTEVENGHIAEWAIWSGDIGDESRQLTRADLADRYGITLP